MVVIGSTAVFPNILKSENRDPEKCKKQRPFNNSVVCWPIKLKLGRDIISDQDSTSKYRNLVALASTAVFPNILKCLKTKTLKNKKTKTLEQFCSLLAYQVETW